MHWDSISRAVANRYTRERRGLPPVEVGLYRAAHRVMLWLARHGYRLCSSGNAVEWPEPCCLVIHVGRTDTRRARDRYESRTLVISFPDVPLAGENLIRKVVFAMSSISFISQKILRYNSLSYKVFCSGWMKKMTIDFQRQTVLI